MALVRISNSTSSVAVLTDLCTVESYCVPHFDSPSVFARILDKDKGGHFSIQPTISCRSKQNYLPSSNVLQTKFMNEVGVVSVTGMSFCFSFTKLHSDALTDFLPRPLHPSPFGASHPKPLLPWLIRRVECIRGALTVNVEVAPAFNYARNPHTTSIVDDDSAPSTAEKHQKAVEKRQKAVFESADLTLDLRYVAEKTVAEAIEPPIVVLTTLDLSAKGHKGLAVQATISLVEGQAVTFVLRHPPGSANSYASPQIQAPKPQTTLGPEVPQAGISQAPRATVGTVDAQSRKASVGVIALENDGSVPHARPHDDPYLTKVSLEWSNHFEAYSISTFRNLFTLSSM